MVEYARNVCNIPDAASDEWDNPEKLTIDPVVIHMPEIDCEVSFQPTRAMDLGVLFTYKCSTDIRRNNASWSSSNAFPG